jgi:hypothetical protein
LLRHEQTYYRTNRASQARLAARPPSASPRFADSCRGYLSRLAGFFIIEAGILRTTRELTSGAAADALWEDTVGGAARWLGAGFAGLDDDAEMLACRLVFWLTYTG